MPEYLAPGVYVEEVSFRAKSLEGVPTSTTGFAGMTRYGPVQYPDGPKSTEPRLITSFTEFERVYGGLESLKVKEGERTGYVAHAARAFFANGGKRLYISRVYVPGDSDNPSIAGVAKKDIPVGDTTATWKARWPGEAGNVLLKVEVARSKNIAFKDKKFANLVQVKGVKAGAIVEVLGSSKVKNGNDPLEVGDLRVIRTDSDGKQEFIGQSGPAAPGDTDVIQLVELQVLVQVDAERTDVYDELGTDPRQKRDISRILQKNDPEDENAMVWLEWDPTKSPTATDQDKAEFLSAQLMMALQQNTNLRLEKGDDGVLADPNALNGKPADPDNAAVKATGLEALGEIDDIAIVALPDGGTYDDVDSCVQAADRLITHAETLRYRIAVVDAPSGSSMTEIREFRGKFDSKYGALYHPWIEILDPTERASQGAPPKRLLLPPSGFVTGIYARSDIERGVHKAPANEVIRGLTKFEVNINKGRQDVLNPEGINALRFFEGRGNRVWGARTMTSDPEWKYVNVRRLFIYIEHTIDKGTQWAVFEPNNHRLWANIRQTVEDFLLVLWKDGALLGEKPEEAYFVRCDRTTMTQNDLDNGRMICLVGVAPVKPAEFVIFRVGQWTADSKI